MSTVIIANPQAKGGRASKMLESIVPQIVKHLGPADFRASKQNGKIEEAVRHAVLDSKPDRIVLVGGDGTFHDGVNGLYDTQEEALLENLPELVLIPLGTGEDFARSLGTRNQNVEEWLSRSKPKLIDLGKIEYVGANGQTCSKLFCNIASSGISAHVAEQVNKSSKRLGGRLSFYLATLTSILTFRNEPVRLTVDDMPPKEIDAMSVVIANGRFFGGGMEMAPRARLDDGLLDVVTIENIGITRFLGQAPKVYKGRHLQMPEIDYTTGRKVVVEPLSNIEIPLETDGELIGRLPITVTILPKALQILLPS